MQTKLNSLAFAALAFLFPTQQETATVSTQAVQRHVKFLASDELKGRRAGTPQADVAARYVASEFLRLGLEPIGEMEENGKSFSQRFEISIPPVPGENSKVEWMDAGQMVGLSAKEVTPLIFSASQIVEGNVYPVTVENIQQGTYPFEFTNPIFTVEIKADFAANPHMARYRQLAMKAKEAGVQGLILWGDIDEKAKKAFEMEGSGSVEIPVVWVSSESKKKIPQRATLQADLKRDKATTRNVIALLPGKEGAKQYVVIGAHYDHLGMGGHDSLSPDQVEIHHGADDNASGTAALIQMANLLAPERGKLERNIVFAAFGAEEEGLLGSMHFVKNPPIPLDQVVAMLNFDMVGRLGDKGKLDLGGVGTSAKLQEIAEKVNKATSTLNVKYSQSPLGGFGGSDHLSFYQKGIPSLFFFTGLHTDYHKPSDTWEKINYEGVLRIAEFGAGVAKEIAGNNDPLPFTKPPEPEKKMSSGGPRAWFGSIPEYGDSNDGVHISGTSSGSPAEKAGMKAGDIITKVGTVEIKTIQDFTYALQTYKPGDVVEVEYIRDKEKKKLSITLGSR